MNADCGMRIAECRARRSQGGFSLIELIITLVVLSLAMVGVLAVFSLGVGHSADPLVVGQATQLAQGELDAVLGEKAANGFNAATLLPAYTTCNSTIPAGFTCTRTICFVPAANLNACGGATSYKRVAATVTNAAGGSIVAVTLLTSY